MFESIDLFNGFMRITYFVGILNFILIIHFCLSWYFNCYRKGYYLDVWHGSLLFSYFITVLLFYPFMASQQLQIIKSNTPWNLSMEYIDKAWFINVLGFCGVFLGGSICSIIRHNGIKIICKTCVKMTETCFYTMAKNENKFIVLFVINSIIASCLNLYAVEQSGSYFNLRVFFMTSGIFLALSNLFISVLQSVFFTVSLLLCYLSKKRYKYYWIYIWTVIIIVMYGGRSTLIFPVITILFADVLYKGKNLSIKKYAVGFLIIVILFFGMEWIRTDSNSTYITESTIVDRILFGNNVSDIRDFSIILENWDGEYLYDKNIIAGMISFIPREYSDFRNQWNTSSYTNRIVGLRENHPGLRGGSFAESFLSFGYIGVFVWGIIYGFVLKSFDLISKAVDNKKHTQSIISIMAVLFTLEIFTNIWFHVSLMWLGYVRILFLIGVYFILRIRIKA